MKTQDYYLICAITLLGFDKHVAAALAFFVASIYAIYGY